MNKLKTLAIATLISGISYGQCENADSVLVRKQLVEQIYFNFASFALWLEEEQGGKIEFDENCKWIWRVRDELEEVIAK